MAIILKKLKQNNGKDVIIDSNSIIGMMGDSYLKLFSQLSSDNIYYMNSEYNFKKKLVKDEIILHSVNYDEKMIDNLLKELSLSNNFLNYKIDDLSNSMKKILKYLLMLIHDKHILVIDEPLVDLDSFYQKKIISILKNNVRNLGKTIIIGSNNSSTIYSLCSKIMFINKNNYIYGDSKKIMFDNNILKDYNIEMPDIIQFIIYAKEKGAKIGRSNDIRDLIKDVYKDVQERSN